MKKINLENWLWELLLAHCNERMFCNAEACRVTCAQCDNQNFLSVDLPVKLIKYGKADLTADQREALGH